MGRKPGETIVLASTDFDHTLAEAARCASSAVVRPRSTRRGSNFFEDGTWIGNLLLRNLGLSTRRPLPANQILSSDATPATYWVQHTQTTLIGNVAAGSSDSHPGPATATTIWSDAHVTDNATELEYGRSLPDTNEPGNALLGHEIDEGHIEVRDTTYSDFRTASVFGQVREAGVFGQARAAATSTMPASSASS